MEYEHRGFWRHGEGAEGYRAAMDSAKGWTYILDRYAAAMARDGAGREHNGSGG